MSRILDKWCNYRTTKTAPHLDGVHVVFGLVISGFEVIKKIEVLKTDAASRPYADVRVVDCGQLITKSANDVLQRKRRKAFLSEEDSQRSSEPSSEFSPSEEESDKKHSSRKRKRNLKSKHSKKKRGAKDGETAKEAELVGHAEEELEAEKEDFEAEQNMKREKPVVRAEEIPPVPENRFLLRKDMPVQEQMQKTDLQDIAVTTNDAKQTVTKSGRKIKGRGTMRYHTPPRSKSRSESEGERGSSETPPHWKEEMQRNKAYQPPSVERWRKEERWDDRNDTPRSRLRSEEHSLSESSTYSSRHHSRKEKKKAKRKKKSKKRKHSKKHKKSKTKDAYPSEGELSEPLGKRWKPDQKPWKPSYIHIQKNSVKSIPGSNALSSSSNVPLEMSSTLKQDMSASQMGSLSNKGSVPERLLQNSLSRSRSPSLSISSSKSPRPLRKRSSSGSRSESYSSQRGRSVDKKRGGISLASGKKREKRANNGGRPKGTSSSEDSDNNPYSPIPKPRDSLEFNSRQDSLSELREEAMKTMNIKGNKEPLVDISIASGWESDGENSSKTQNVAEHNQHLVKNEELTEMRKRQILSRCWESESDSEMPDNIDVGHTKRLSEKEEGEASTESDEDLLWLKQCREVAEEVKSNVQDSTEAKPSKHKNKKGKRKHKHKRKSASKSESHKSKNKKSKKRQKPKEIFHWQPPLEFGDEGEEDDPVNQTKQLQTTKPDSVADGPNRQMKGEPNEPNVPENMDQDHKNFRANHDMFSEECSSVIDENGKMIQAHKSKLQRKSTKGLARGQPEIISNLSEANLVSHKLDPKKSDSPEIIPEAQQQESKATGFSPMKNVLNTSGFVPSPKEKGIPVVSAQQQLVQQEETLPADGSAAAVENKWKPLIGMTIVPPIATKPLNFSMNKKQAHLEGKTQGLKIEIKSKKIKTVQVKKTVLKQPGRKQNPLEASRGPCPAIGPTTTEAGPIHIDTAGADPEATRPLPGATVEVEAGVDTVEGTLVLEVAPTGVTEVDQTVEADLEAGVEAATGRGLTPTIVILATVVAEEEGVEEAKALTAGQGHIAPTVMVPLGGEAVAEAVATVEFKAQ
ncbi:hypothetical protein DNTS_022800 [Danionella cerebrum]|uniref:PPIase cyclophilin-type domain-containing protein n=1 Tax=Danionella cerebrum TaxID=2873325 RepID=A0A553MTN6_9TELE|nr:hypothetical protein DNTS_022800 [Danionella translucida]TRY56546.1 hypothetical protein DNTS_022800 [Danionella translucida]TRY56547.1 hypothetical protein DNTS_022800 [Danionella translucida]